MILLWGLPDERPFGRVLDALLAAGETPFVLDQRRIPQTTLEVELDEHLRGVLRVDDRQLALEAVTAAYHRPYETTSLPVVRRAGCESALFRHAIGVEVLLSSWLELTEAHVLNRPSLMASNNSKPFQSQLIARLGFSVPDTLLTTSDDAAVSFWQQRGEVVYKSVSGTRSIVSRLGERHVGRLRHIATCPTQLQAFVPGADVRVHVVGDEIFACEVESDADDYRYAARSGAPARLRATSLPDDVEERCLGVAAGLGLPLVGLDLRRTADGEWFCFEANPSPGFSWFEEHTGQPIAAAIARLLASPRA